MSRDVKRVCRELALKVKVLRGYYHDAIQKLVDHYQVHLCFVQGWWYWALNPDDQWKPLGPKHKIARPLLKLTAQVGRFGVKPQSRLSFEPCEKKSP